MTDSKAHDPFEGPPSGQHETPGIFATLEPGQSARGIFLGMIPGGTYGEQPAIYSLKAGRVMIWPAHQLLVGAIAELPAWSPVEIARLAIPGRAAKYSVKSWPVLGAGDQSRAKVDVALKETLELLGKVRGGGPPAGRLAPAAAVDGSGPLNPADDDLPF